jgi:polyisoprenoid-binding protein YceI
MTIETKWPTESAHNQIAFKVRSLMLTNVKGSFNKFDTNLISKYLAIANINFEEIKKT